jgi:putative ABC transport system ATP-binding protein
MTPRRLEAIGLGVSLGGQAVLEGVDLTALAGAPVAVSGPSGSGKTILLHALAGLLPAISGRVLLDGDPLDRGDGVARSRFGVILQAQGLASGLTAEENVALPLQARGLDRKEVAARSRDALEAVGLDGAADRLVDGLSGGQRQRVGVARALAGSPEILVADEPTAELDPSNRSRILSLLLDPSAGRIVIIASNDPEVCSACSHVVHLRDGRVLSLD